MLLSVSAWYFNNTSWSGTPDVQTEVPQVNFFWPEGYSPDPAIQNNYFSTEFTGKITAPETGTYTLISNTDDDGYLWVNGQLVSSDPGTHGMEEPPSQQLVAIDLVQDQSYNFVFRQRDGNWDAAAIMEWITPSNSWSEPIPDYYLSPAADVPIVPADFVVAKESSNSICLAWTDNSVSETGYLIERSVNGGEYSPIGNTGPVSNPGGQPATGTFVDHDVVLGMTYQYRLSAYSHDGSTAAIESDNATPNASVPATGASAWYYTNGAWSGAPAVQTIVPQVDFSWGDFSPDPAIPNDNFSTEFTGKIVAPSTGTYYLISNTDDDGYLWVNGQLVSSDPGGHGTRFPWWNIYAVDLIEAQSYNFVGLRQIR